MTAPNRRICLALDLVDDTAAIAAYERWHAPGATPPAVIASIRAAGIAEMEIHRAGNRLLMVMDVTDDFSFERKAAMDAGNPAVAEWEAQMAAFQQPLPGTPDGGKWRVMERVFRLSEH